MSYKEKTSKKSFFAGAAAGILCPLIFWEIIQGIAAFTAGATNLSFKLSGIKLYACFDLGRGIMAGTAILLIPYILSLSSVVIAFRLLKKASSGFKRHFLISFLLILSGSLIIDLFYGAFSVILKFNQENDWVKLVSLLGLSEAGSIIFIFLIILFTVGYLNLSLKRILNYIKI